MAKNSKHRRGGVSKPGLGGHDLLSDTLRQLKSGQLTKQNLEDFNEHRNPFEVSNQLDIDDVVTILGADKVVTMQQAVGAFNFESLAAAAKGEVDTSIRYNMETLRECAVLNRYNQRDWRMVYGLPLSLREQRENGGTDRENQSFFYDSDWWLGDKEDGRAKSQPEAGYYLIDFKRRFEGTNWNDQNTRITEMGDAYERADVRVFAQALISIFKTHGERLHSGTYHGGRIKDSDGYLVVGFFDSDGISVHSFRPSGVAVYLVVCVARKFDF